MFSIGCMYFFTVNSLDLSLNAVFFDLFEWNWVYSLFGFILCYEDGVKVSVDKLNTFHTNYIHHMGKVW